MIKSKKKLALSTALALSMTLPQMAPAVTHAAENEDIVKLRVMETTDIHVNLVNYDYYKDAEVQDFGLAKTATLIKQAREEAKNSLLFDNGDLIQGNPLGDYVAKVDVLEDGETHPVYKAMNLLDYDAGNIGNHEFNYGLDFLGTSLKGSNFPYVNANVYIDDQDGDATNDENYFTPYLILDREVVDEDGETHTLKVGVIGFTPPQIMNWDKKNLEGKVIAKDIIETAEKFVPEMKEKGADIIVAIPHSGIGKATDEGMQENATFELSKVEGIDAILFGHSHSVFPSETYADIEGVDVETGKINGVASVMPGYWGNHLGLIDFTLEKKDDSWTVVDSQSSVQAIYDKESNTPLVDADQSIVDAVHEEHEGTIEWVNSPVGTTTAPINSYFALVQDDPSIQIVTNAQKWYVENYVQGTEYEGLPILSAGAPFKAGGRGGATYYTDVPAGEIAIKNVADMYLYPNTLQALLINGADVKEWLEMSAGQFNQIDASSTEEQELINVAFPTYNFDVIDGVSYQVDVTQPAKYDDKGNIVNPDASRIVNLQFEGKEVSSEQKFIVVTNNYRATGGGNFPGISADKVIIESPDENRQAIINYILDKQTINPSADMNWSFAPINSELNVTFETSPEATKYLEGEKIAYIETLESGFAKFSIDLVGDQQGDDDNENNENNTDDNENNNNDNESDTESKQFTDVPENHWAKQYIDELTAMEIIKGKSATIFDPNANVTRAQFASLIVRSLGLTSTNESPFKDVSAEQAAEITAAFEAGIVTGKTSTIFDPSASITREQAAAMLIRAYNVKMDTTHTPSTELSYSDASSIGDWAKDYVTSANELGMMTGYLDGSFGPSNTATRAQAAKVIYMLLQQ
ncbi:bifunctional 2',3'-cyclic-nucleotide 2'-phosphodiesterase/3'-nucleotidase [Cytobacillus sp. IB215665]|uniref:bifunctional 2',3'-cyclic-nucleotide 2'-phosphodiesterase/3'-nucleotidase n=1 Tax=Cytobacillus sp. IB215665 TaxID=3097357 RepID=UPI002A1655FE|nr:bifunctional 2',3'-cyclic-nucleotide 2'-phosphodiesterase/3'-nucleotidase [Cytobacillus sp. IB215665]MDX8366885.1 bifunctional 2',3'-cyclic-nucleotide 2'-phosphodiesterase/3'-nucleotidase [Cytobacillus sp. IB215665]